MTIAELLNIAHGRVIDLNVFDIIKPDTESDESVITANCAITTDTCKCENSSTDSISETVEDTDVYCYRCGRKLKDKQSRMLGIGPACYRLHQKERNKQINLFAMKQR